jgi:hypothetical protein
MLLWLSGYDTAGNWNPELSKQSIKQHPILPKKEQAKTKSLQLLLPRTKQPTLQVSTWFQKPEKTGSKFYALHHGTV